MPIPALPLFRHRETVVTPADQNQFVTQFENTMDTLSNGVIPALNLSINDMNTQYNNIYNNLPFAPDSGYSQAHIDKTFVKLTGNSATATKLQTARTINGVAFDGSANITVSDPVSVKLSTNRTNYKNITDSVVVGELMWKNYGNGHTIFDTSASTSPFGAAVNNTNPDVPWSEGRPTLMGYNGEVTFGVRVDSSRTADRLNTTIGTAPAYACRAWVNFNGTGTVAIRASGNVSSITDRGVGQYTINFTTAMSDTSYTSLSSSANRQELNALDQAPFVLQSTTQLNVANTNSNSAAYADNLNNNWAIFR